MTVERCSPRRWDPTVTSFIFVPGITIIFPRRAPSPPSRAACFALIYYVHIMFVFIVVSVGIYFQAALLERVFRNYMPDEDEELEKEDVGDFNINDERQAIINRYLGRSTENSALDEGNLVLVDKNGEEIKEEDYKVVKVEKDE